MGLLGPKDEAPSMNGFVDLPNEQVNDNRIAFSQ
jgi:hypothetical protein